MGKLESLQLVMSFQWGFEHPPSNWDYPGPGMPWPS